MSAYVAGEATRALFDSPAIVLRVTPVGEADLIFVLLTQLEGRVEARARGARKSRRRFSGGVGVAAMGVATLQRGRGELWNLQEFQLDSNRGALGRDLEAFAWAGYACELCDRLLAGSHDERGAFALVQGLLLRLATGAIDPIALRQLELGLLEHAGFRPALCECAVCGRPLLSEDLPTEFASEMHEGDTELHLVGFDPQRGGALCEAHRLGAPGTPSRQLRAAAALLDGTEADLAWLTKRDRRGLRDICQALIRLHLRSELKSLSVLAQLARQGVLGAGSVQAGQNPEERSHPREARPGSAPADPSQSPTSRSRSEF